MKEFAIGIDIGGTTTKFGIVNRKGEIIMQDRIPSNKHEVAEDFIDDLYNKLKPMIDSMGGNENFVGIGMGAPNGNFYSGTIEYAPNLKFLTVLVIIIALQGQQLLNYPLFLVLPFIYKFGNKKTRDSFIVYLWCERII